MKKSDFYYHLPPELIAQEPLPERSAGRLLLVDPGSDVFQDARVRDLPRFLRPGDLLVFNDTRVLPARLWARKTSGGSVELLLERLLTPERARFLARASKPLRTGGRLILAGGETAEILTRDERMVELGLVGGGSWLDILEAQGEVPLPPYIDRAPAAADRDRYQTVYARTPGAVAAPTAGLHFDAELLAALDKAGIQRAYITLHVGAGTFLPVQVEKVEEHRMHSERVTVPAATVEQIRRAREQGGRIFAIGTTVCRALEAAASDQGLQAFVGETDIFLYPGRPIRVIDGLFTNFHLPESTLMMLVSALAGRERILAAYAHAVAQRYRFFSYGDAMLILPAGGNSRDLL
ncbi:tRNA preQ1(34) S-adenosylmethionine ribosyltransferase-isomerase QueA [Acidithiobacillus sp.]|uniref:tRNA preQ1(34) S-adenosylmethionine ribosyltransferase-isomerase QueA n=1 Tax=Acidithiobacillus sp. TaxID=1872118 RepID=UPI0025C44E2C|nr:tRNA preQ1(34) S-adenosylmethionine ribosyltransferase-isomerase QueA [Acidithiobacillus sp.]